jgi:hypothetical protein
MPAIGTRGYSVSRIEITPLPNVLYRTRKRSAVVPRHPCTGGVERDGRTPDPLSNQREHV